MSQLFKFSTSKAIVITALALAAPLALASDVSWAISVGSPRPVPVYAPPPPVVYVQPEPVYVRPAPVYVRPAPVVQYYGGPYYVEEIRYKKFKPHHWKHHRHYED